jgi:hypothetical protein
MASKLSRENEFHLYKPASHLPQHYYSIVYEGSLIFGPQLDPGLRSRSAHAPSGRMKIPKLLCQWCPFVYKGHMVFVVHLI